MASTFRIPKAQFIMALIMPLAVILGYFLVDPLETSTVAVVGLVLAALVLPLMMQWYHPFLILAWNASIAPAFVPGSPQLWMLVSLAGFFIAILNRSVNANFRFVSAPSITNSLLCLAVVVCVTAYFNGGIGSFIFGSSKFGGRRYFYTFLAIVGYFVLVSQRIPVRRAALFTSLFFLSSLTALVPDVLGLLGSSSSFLYLFFPIDQTAVAAVSGTMADQDIFRIYGLTFSSMGVFYALLAKYGIRGLCDWHNPWRAAVFFLSIAAAFYSGYRSILLILGLTFVIQFYLEGLHRTRLLGIFLGLAVLGGGILLTQSERLPLVVQRTISFLPVQISPVARMSADSSTEWRVGMWKAVLPKVPSHLPLGEGYSIDPTALYFSEALAIQDFDWAIITGDYHNGPLSLVIPFGIWGVIAFGWFCTASLIQLYRNFRFGAPELKTINTLLLAWFIARLIFFCFFFGGFWSDLCLFTGCIGLSLSLNGAQPKYQPKQVTEPEEHPLMDPVFRDDYA